ncbi:MAG: preprotein translocase subunit SecE [Terracidiphilus sp.]|jgi:preprotein translocase subunit SecE
MATKAAMVNGDDQPRKRQGDNPLAKVFDSAVEQWKEFTRFLSDVRSEMRKVVTPSRKEVQSTTIVVLIAVGIFGLYFFVVDSICSQVMNALYKKLGG